MLQSADPGSTSLASRTYEVGGGREVNVNDSDDYLFILPVSHGRLWVRAGGGVIHDGPVRPGMVRIVRPGERSAMAAQSGFGSLVVRMHSGQVRAAAEHTGARVPALNAEIPVVLRARSDLLQLGKSLTGALATAGRRREVLVYGLSVALLALVFDGHCDPEARAVEDGLDDRQWAAAVNFADASLDSGLAIEAWADAVGLSTHEFARRFRARVGSPPYAWFMDRRVDRACQLLLNSDDSIVNVALASGFNSQSHFTDAFRRRTGTSPGRWRAELRR